MIYFLTSLLKVVQRDRVNVNVIRLTHLKNYIDWEVL